MSPRILSLTAAIALAAALSPHAVEAQGHPLVGTWKVEFAVGMRMENGVGTAMMGSGTLTVASAGDSLIATISREAVEGIPARPPARMAAKATGPTVVFEQRSEARLNTNGEEMVREALTEWTLTANGDAVTGTMKRSIPGLDLPDMGAQPVKGTRMKS